MGKAARQATSPWHLRFARSVVRTTNESSHHEALDATPTVDASGCATTRASARQKARTDNMHGCAVAQRALCELLGRFGALRVITHVMTAASIGASRGGGYARYLESKTVEP